MKKQVVVTIMLGFLLALSLLTNAQYAYAVHKGDSFSYSETATVNNGQGSYTGYTDKTLVTGSEQVNSVNGSSVSSYYHFSYQYSNNQGNSSTSSSSGNYTWSSGNFTYTNGTDNQVGYSKPIYVWFAMNTSLPIGGTFYVLNTQFTVLSKNYSFQLPTLNNQYVQTIQAKGTGQYQRNDSYGIFTASYTWYEYFDPTTGYIVGYNYLEQDNGKYQGQVGSFTYTDDLYVTTTSYKLAPASPPTTSATNTATNINQNLVGLPIIYLAVILGLVLLILVGVYAAIRRNRRRGSLPQHPYPPTTPPPNPWESKVNLGSQPPEQVVVREVAKVNCKFCGTLIPSTAGTCPYCGAPRQ